MIQGHRPDARVPLALLALVTPVLVLTLVFCRAGRLNWLLEVAPALVYGAYYTYAETPHDRSMARVVGVDGGRALRHSLTA